MASKHYWPNRARSKIGCCSLFTNMPIPCRFMYFWFLLFSPPVSVLAQWIDYPDDGLATMTHYTLPSGYVASCGCTPSSTDYPTAALSQMAYGSSTSYGNYLSLLLNSLLFSIHHRSELWKMLQLDFSQPRRRKPSFCAFGSQAHCCENHRSLSINTKWLVFWHNNESQPVCLSPSRIPVIISQKVPEHTLILTSHFLRAQFQRTSSPQMRMFMVTRSVQR